MTETIFFSRFLLVFVWKIEENQKVVQHRRKLADIQQANENKPRKR